MDAQSPTPLQISLTPGTGDRPVPITDSAVRRRSSVLSGWLPGVLLVLGAAALYVLTLDNGLQPYQLLGGDLITHQYAQAQGRFSNAPGYPLFTMGGWLWFHGRDKRG